MSSTQYRLIVAKKDERTSGPDDADVVIAAPIDVVKEADFDATVEYMRGRVKAQGSADAVLAAFKESDVTSELVALVAQA